MSALGQKQTLIFRSDDARLTSKANIDATQSDVCFVPIADIEHFAATRAAILLALPF
jgi:hypothetical protein